MPYLHSRVRIAARAFNYMSLNRGHHSATAKWITLTPEGSEIRREMEVFLGGPSNTYVALDPEISRAYRTAAGMEVEFTEAGIGFHHPTRQFFPIPCGDGIENIGLNKFPYPRIEIPHDLPQQWDDRTSTASYDVYERAKTYLFV